jgi:hypothetical protein
LGAEDRDRAAPRVASGGARGAPLAHTLPLAMVPEGLALSRLDRRVGGHRLAGIRGSALIGFGSPLLGRQEAWGGAPHPGGASWGPLLWRPLRADGNGRHFQPACRDDHVALRRPTEGSRGLPLHALGGDAAGRCARAGACEGGAPAAGGEPQEGLAPLRGGPREERPLGGGGGGLQ